MLAGGILAWASGEPRHVTIAEEGVGEHKHNIFVLHLRTFRGTEFDVRVLPGEELEGHFHTGALLRFTVNERGIIKYGDLVPPQEEEGDKVVGENGHSISYRDLCDIIRARVEEMVRR